VWRTNQRNARERRRLGTIPDKPNRRVAPWRKSGLGGPNALKTPKSVNPGGADKGGYDPRTNMPV